jgi:putative glycosyltransferase (TIGR04372 family)
MTIVGDVEIPALSEDAIRAAAREVVQLSVPHLAPGQKTLAYILPQSARIGHFGLETQIISTLFEDEYDRILIFTDKMSWPGTNPWIRQCAGPKFRFIEVDNFDVLLLGTKDAGFHRIGSLDCLFASPRAIFIRFYRHILAGGAVKYLELPEEAESIARETLSRRGIDPDAPFVFFHNRTLSYVPTMTYHAYRTAVVETYQPAIRRLIETGYRVIRIGEPELDTMGFPPDAYVNIPDWGDVDRAVDLFVLARNAFGLAQNSGPIWVAGAFGRPVLRTNAPFEHMNMPYNDDLTLFKHYHVAGSAEPMAYRQILDAGIPAILFSDKIAEAGYEVRDNTPDELLAATEELLTRMAGTWQRDVEADSAFRALGAEYEARIAADPAMQASNFAFYGYAHPFGSLARVTLETQPGFLD